MKYRNPDGTYNGIAALAELSGLFEAEIRWTFIRLKELMTSQGLSREQALAIVKGEAADKPWLS